MDDLTLLCTREAAAALGVDRMTVLRLVWAGRLKAIRIGTGRTNAWAFREEDLTHYAHTHGRHIDLAAGLALAVPSGGGPHTLPKEQEPRAQSFSGVKTFNDGIVVPDAGSGHPRQNNNPLMILDEPNNVCYLRSIDGEFEEVAFEVGGPHTLSKGQEPLFPLDPPRPKETP